MTKRVSRSADWIVQSDSAARLLDAWGVIAKAMLIEFWSRHPDAEAPLLAWLRVMQNRSFGSFDSLRRVYASADRVAGLTVFDVGGNKYRLITAIHYNREKVYLRHVLTHAAYDRGTWKRRSP